MDKIVEQIKKLAQNINEDTYIKITNEKDVKRIEIKKVNEDPIELEIVHFDIEKNEQNEMINKIIEVQHILKRTEEDMGYIISKSKEEAEETKKLLKLTKEGIQGTNKIINNIEDQIIKDKSIFDIVNNKNLKELTKTIDKIDKEIEKLNNKKLELNKLKTTIENK